MGKLRLRNARANWLLLVLLLKNIIISACKWFCLISLGKTWRFQGFDPWLPAFFQTLFEVFSSHLSSWMPQGFVRGSPNCFRQGGSLRKSFPPQRSLVVWSDQKRWLISWKMLKVILFCNDRSMFCSYAILVQVQANMGMPLCSTASAFLRSNSLKVHMKCCESERFYGSIQPRFWRAFNPYRYRDWHPNICWGGTLDGFYSLQSFLIRCLDVWGILKEPSLAKWKPGRPRIATLSKWAPITHLNKVLHIIPKELPKVYNHLWYTSKHLST